MYQLLPYAFPPFVWLMLYWLNLRPNSLALLLGIFFTVSATVFFLMSRGQFIRFFHTWIHYWLFAVTSFGIMMIIENPGLRFLYACVVGFIWGWVCYSLIQFFKPRFLAVARHYIEINQFVHLVSYWQLCALLYFNLTFFNLPLWVAIILIGAAAASLGWDIFRWQRLKKSSPVLVVSVLALTSIELALFIWLLPIRFFAAGAILTIWLYFVIDITLRGQVMASRQRLFHHSLVLLLLLFLVLLLTARWY